MATRHHQDDHTTTGSERVHRAGSQAPAHRDAKTESRTQRPDHRRDAGQARGKGSDDTRSGSESGSG